MLLKARLANVVLAAITGVSSIAYSAQLAELRPVDEAPKRADFFTFRAHLQMAVARRDVDAVLGIVHPTIRTSFGPDNGLAAFKAMWRLGAPDSDLWQELGAVLALGGSFEGEDAFVAPYVFSKWPDDLDSSEYVAVIGDNVAVRTRPTVSAARLSSVSFAILRTRGDSNEPEGWSAVQLDDGRKGFIASRYVRSPIDHRAYFAFVDGRWLMTAFIAGD
jgi:hypothetical protein